MLSQLSGRCAVVPLVLAILATLGLRNLPAQDPPKVVQFNRDIRPILSDNCFRCHGPDKNQRKADLRLDSKENAFADLGGYPAIVPGSPDKSELFGRITASDPADRMPPAETGKALRPRQIELIKRWIQQGAHWQSHWSLITPVRLAPPKVKQTAWVRNPIDRFILARQEIDDLEPSADADRRTLIRRVTLDLTGLPPTLAEIQAFLADQSPDAYEKIVDRLLSSEHYGEHMARFWLDAARYGDTHGLHLDNYREMWPYRDWVIRAFNGNMPYDQFAIEQLAGDLLPEPTLDQTVATGFNRCHVTTNEGGSISEEVYVRNVVDRVSTLGTVFLGMTLGCAVCHEHKFDPVSQKEFYQLFAFFNSIDGAAMDGNVKDHAPAVRVPTREQSEILRRLRDKEAAASADRAKRLEAVQPAFEAWLNWRKKMLEVGGQTVKLEMPQGLEAHFHLDEQSGDAVANAVDPKKSGSVKGKANWVQGRLAGGFKVTADSYIDLGAVGDFDRKQSFSYGAWIKTPGKVSGAALAKMDVKTLNQGYDLTITRRRVAAHLIRRWPGYAIKVTTKGDVLRPNQWHHVFVTYDGSGKAAGVKLHVDGRPQEVVINSDSLRERDSIRTSAPLLVGRRHLGSPFTGGEVDDVRVYDRRLTELEVASVAWNDQIETILAAAPDNRTAQQAELLRKHYLQQYDTIFRDLTANVNKLQQAQRKVTEGAPTTLVFRELEKPRDAYLLERGQYDRRHEKVQRSTPAALLPMADDLPRNRLGLARWLVSPKHPLTSRVAVNRFWQQCFGTGLVKTSEDFGTQGEAPSHPDLLDWLAVEFRESGWDVKELMRLIVTSSSYRQTSRVTSGLLEKDPDNRLLARGPRFRLDAEMLRDQALAISGLLVRKIGGPSVKPPQPDGLWFAVGYSGSNTVKFKQDTGPDKVYRRSLYTFWKRTASPPQMNIFDAPSREACTVRRERTNTPLQALLLMNDPQYVEAARCLAERILKEGGTTTEQRCAFAFESVTARMPSQQDTAAMIAAVNAHLAEYQADPEAARKLIGVGESNADRSLDPAELAAWTMVTNLILNLDEVIAKG